MIIGLVKNPYGAMLTARAWTAAEMIEKSITNFYRRRNRTPRKKTYPAVVSACCSEYKNNKVYIDFSHGMRAKFVDPRLARVLQELGMIGEQPVKNSRSKNKIGHCAEQHAANDLLNEQRGVTLDDIYFGLAFRPRTGEYIPPCENCTYVFPNLR